MTLSFLALPVIPELKITDMGLVDVAALSWCRCLSAEANLNPHGGPIMISEDEKHAAHLAG